MIRKLRRKFIWIAMVSMAFVLGTIIVVINVLNYQKSNAYSDQIITLLLENEGVFPEDSSPLPEQGGERPEGAPDNLPEGERPEIPDGMPEGIPDDIPEGERPEIPDGGVPGGGISPEARFETRYFSVVLNEAGEVVSSDTQQIAAITQETAESYAKTLFEEGKFKGMHGNYKYRSKATEQGTLYVFLDCTREKTTFQDFLQTSTLISLGGLAVVFILIIIFSYIALKPVEESHEKQKHFITNASHDIKTPLTIINAGAEVIELERGEGEWTREIKKQAERLTALTDKLVFLSRMDEENYRIEKKEFDFSRMISETVEPYNGVAATKGFAFSLDCPNGITYKGNEEMLSRAIALIMDNAMKYTSENGSISVRVKKMGKGVELHFKNTAQGVKIGNNNELFERFYRADKSRNSKLGGQGIGLSVVKAIITAHKGKISAHSADGKSMEFSIYL